MEGMVWKFPNNTAVVMLMGQYDGAPHGVTVHRSLHCDERTFGVDIAVAVQDTVQSVSSEVSLAWPGHATYEAWPDTDGKTQSIVCPGFHKIRIHLREGSFMPGMLPHVDMGIIVAADRFTPPLLESVQKRMKQCDVFMVSTRGGGETYVDDRRRTDSAMPYLVTREFEALVQPFDAADDYTTVGHNHPPRGELIAKGKKFNKSNKSLPMIWLRCHHSVRQHPDTRRIKGKGKDKGKLKGKGWRQ